MESNIKAIENTGNGHLLIEWKGKYYWTSSIGNPFYKTNEVDWEEKSKIARRESTSLSFIYIDSVKLELDVKITLYEERKESQSRYALTV